MRTKSGPRYRKVSTRIWTDPRFLRLSPLRPSGQGLWIWMITGPLTRQVPGLFKASLSMIQEELPWSLPEINAALEELENEGLLRFDREARLIWLPKALKHNIPASANVIAGWHEELITLPECGLKTEAIQSMRAQLNEIGPAHADAFDQAIGLLTPQDRRRKAIGRKNDRQRRTSAKALGNASGKASGKTSGKSLGKASGKASGKAFGMAFGKESQMASGNQELEQDQEQEQKRKREGCFAVTSTSIARACRMMEAAGATQTDPAYPRLIEALEVGVTHEELAAAVAEGVKRGREVPFHWACATVLARRSPGIRTIPGGASSGRHSTGAVESQHGEDEDSLYRRLHDENMQKLAKEAQHRSDGRHPLKQLMR